MSWSIEGNVLVLPSGRRLSFADRIAKVVEIGSTIVVRLDTTEARQLYGVRDESVVWQAPKLPDGLGYDVDVDVRDRNLFAWDFAGLRVELDPITGPVLDVVFTK